MCISSNSNVCEEHKRAGRSTYQKAHPPLSPSQDIPGTSEGSASELTQWPQGLPTMPFYPPLQVETEPAVAFEESRMPFFGAVFANFDYYLILIGPADLASSSSYSGQLYFDQPRDQYEANSSWPLFNND